MAVERHNYCKSAFLGGLVRHIDRRTALLDRPVMLGQQVELAVLRVLAELVQPVMALLVPAFALPNLEPQEELA